MAEDLLFEIGVEELPASFVAGALGALPDLLRERLASARLAHGQITALGTPRRLAVVVRDVARRQADLDEELLGPPARVAFDADGRATRAAQSFAERCGVPVEALERRTTPKGEYLAGRRREPGREAAALLPGLLAEVARAVPFRKSMRWAERDETFGRPVRWLLARHGDAVLRVEAFGLSGGGVTFGHRFLAPGSVEVRSAQEYVATLRGAHVLVDPHERRRVLLERLHAAAAALGGTVIEDAFLLEENLSLVEEPWVVSGSFAEEFLVLPERVILEVARGHQRWFGVRGPEGRMLPAYLAVVNTARNERNVRRGNDRVMRARLSDARFFWETDLAVWQRELSKPPPERDFRLGGITFHQRLGTVADKVERVALTVSSLAADEGLPGEVREVAVNGLALAKCDLTSGMVGELPELQGEMGRAYALHHGVDPAVAAVIAEHYQPRSADDATAPSAAGALVAVADRLDTLVGCFAIGAVPTGSADPLGLRRAALGVLRTYLDQGWRQSSLPGVVASVYGRFAGVRLDHGQDETVARVSEFLWERLRGLLVAELPADAVDAVLALRRTSPPAPTIPPLDVYSPVDARERARALAALSPEVRARAGEVFKRAANIAREAPPGEPRDPAQVSSAAEPAERALHEAVAKLERALAPADLSGTRDYARCFAAVAEFAPVLHAFFEAVYVMTDHEAVRENRLRLLAKVHRLCSELAHLNLLAPSS